MPALIWALLSPIKMAPVKCLSGKGLGWGGSSFSWSVLVQTWEHALTQESHLDPEKTCSFKQPSTALAWLASLPETRSCPDPQGPG